MHARYRRDVASRVEDLSDLPAPAPGQPRYINRELSQLDFNARVLAQAADSAVPLLERAKFVAIFSGNQDEFFQVRVAGLKDQLAAGVGATLPSGDTPTEQLSAVAAGARVERPLADQFYGDRSATLIDPFGHKWTIATHTEDVPPDEMKRRMDAMMKQQGGG